MATDEILALAGVKRNELVGSWEGKWIDEEFKYKVHILLTKKELIIVSKKGWLRKQNVRLRMPVKRISQIQKVPLLGTVSISGNVTQKDAKWYRKLAGMRSFQLKMNNRDSFINKIKELQGKAEVKEKPEEKEPKKEKKPEKEDDNALKILKKRYAKGEISKKEYNEIKKELKS